MSDAVQSPPDSEELRAEVEHKLLCTVAAEPSRATRADLYQALAQVAREQLAKRWVDTQNADRDNKSRRVYYLSMEFLIGRAMNNALSALDLRDSRPRPRSTPPGPSLDEVMECEPDAALGNGGLGRLAACFLDSMATLGLPSWGYGVRYEYGMFAQSIINGQQVEHPDSWLVDRSPWEFPRANKHFTVHFGGTCRAPRRMGRMACGRRRRSPRVRLRHPRPWHRSRQHPAPVESRRAIADRPRRLQHRRLRSAPPSSRTTSRTSPGFSTRTTAPRPVVNCACARSISSSAASMQDILERHHRGTRHLTTSPSRSRSTSTTRTRRSASPN
jgi:hypothetical protein